MKLCFLDFEFNGISEETLNLVSVAALCKDGGKATFERFFWLYGSPGVRDKEARAFFLRRIQEGYIFVSYVMEAEARGLMALFMGEDTWTEEIRAIDLYLEYRCLLNHNHGFAYGEQLIRGQIIKTTPPPNKWEVSSLDEEEEAHHKPSFSLAAAAYKLLGERVDTVEKDRVRDIIIRSDPGEILAAQKAIEAYNISDLKYLPQLFEFFDHYFTAAAGEVPEFWLNAALLRGDYAVRTARMIRHGYPVNQEKLGMFAGNVEAILKSAAEACNQAEEGLRPFRFDRRLKRYVLTEKVVRDWIGRQSQPYWRKTEKKSLSLSKDAFLDWYTSQTDGFAGAFCRYLKTKQSLNGFLPSVSKRGRFSDFVGKDGRVRPYFGIYGSQSSRSQPGATGFIPLKAHWMRNFLEAPKGRALAGVDYASQEFLIAGILSQDEGMLKAYESGDVYLAFAVASNLAPSGATRASHGLIREVCKALVLGISYDMSARGLAPRLTQLTKRQYSEDEAQGLINTFYDIYSDYDEWKREVQAEYRDNGYLLLPDGWAMWGDNDNPRSVGNFPVQGHGAVIMREAVRLAQKRQLDVIFTLHDAVYIEYPAYEVDKILALQVSMQEAFFKTMSLYGKTVPIRLEGESWCPDYGVNKPLEVFGVKYLDTYIDAKGKNDYERYRPYFDVTIAKKDEHHGIQKSLGGPEVFQI